MVSRSKRRSDHLFESLREKSISGHQNEISTEGMNNVHGQDVLDVPDTTRLPRMKKFRFQLLHRWLIHNFEACRVADIGGGKGLLGYLLMESGWQSTVIDPVSQDLPSKYKDIDLGRRVKIDPESNVPNIPAEFEIRHAENFDLLIAMHAHGCNAKIIDAAAQYGCGFVIFPCCVIDEPFYPPLGVHWLESLADYAMLQGLVVTPFRLNFKGQNIGLYSLPRRV